MVAVTPNVNARTPPEVALAKTAPQDIPMMEQPVVKTSTNVSQKMVAVTPNVNAITPPEVALAETAPQDIPMMEQPVAVRRWGAKLALPRSQA